jgi:PPP family 3-phenylpropionic acid transporter
MVLKESAAAQESSSIRSITIHGLMLEAAYYFGYCAYLAFIIADLIQHGWSQSAAAGAMTVMSMITVLIHPLFGYLSDSVFSEKRLIVTFLILTLIPMALLPVLLERGSHLLILLDMVCITLTASQVGGILDAWLVNLRRAMPDINYGFIRGFGSLAYALSAQLLGMITVRFGTGSRYLISSCFLGLAILAALTLRSTGPRPTRAERKQDAGRLSGRQAIRILLSSRRYLLLLSVSFFILLSASALGTLQSICILEFGGTSANIGTASAISAGTEVPFLFVMAAIIRRTGEKKLLIFCAVTYSIRLFATAFLTSVSGLLWIQLTQGITFGIFLPASMSYLVKIADARASSTAVTVFNTVTYSITAILGNLISSLLLGAGLSAHQALLYIAFPALIGLGIAIYGSVRKIW